ncbi:hypothetical protein F4678DRAFT_439749 [Xylaria arbuscula]|nr:hypothetical protein F4678DRAFT_439749 [Xylaria arbuscula]
MGVVCFRRCKALNLTGDLKRIGSSSRLVVQGEAVINGVDSTLERLAGQMQQLQTDLEC